MIAFGGRRGPHRSGSRCRGRPIERREAGREGCLWPNAASQGRPPDGSGGESERSTQNGRAKTLCGGGGGGGGSNSELPQAGFPESGEVSRHFRYSNTRAKRPLRASLLSLTVLGVPQGTKEPYLKTDQNIKKSYPQYRYVQWFYFLNYFEIKIEPFFGGVYPEKIQ